MVIKEVNHLELYWKIKVRKGEKKDCQLSFKNSGIFNEQIIKVITKIPRLQVIEDCQYQ